MTFDFDRTETEAQNLQAAMNEIERQSASLDSAEALIRKNAERMNEMQKEIERLQADNIKWREYNQELYLSNQTQAKRIAELENALVEERAKSLCYQSIAQTPTEAAESGCYPEYDFSEMPIRWQSKFRIDAGEQLRQEGKL